MFRFPPSTSALPWDDERHCGAARPKGQTVRKRLLYLQRVYGTMTNCRFSWKRTHSPEMEKITILDHFMSKVVT